MNLHEYQGKELLNSFGVRIQRGIVASTKKDAVEAAKKLNKETGTNWWVVKAQIHAGGRGKGGGVKLAKSLDEVASISNDILYIADNLGYIYALDLLSKNIIWAKNFGIPFRSNLIAVENQIFLANQDNKIYSLDRFTGEIKWNFPTSESLLKSTFINSIIADTVKKNLFFLNNAGELYSINYMTQNIIFILFQEMKKN